MLAIQHLYGTKLLKFLYQTNKNKVIVQPFHLNYSCHFLKLSKKFTRVGIFRGGVS